MYVLDETFKKKLHFDYMYDIIVIVILKNKIIIFKLHIEILSIQFFFYN